LARLRYISLYKYHHYLRKEIEIFKEQKTNIFMMSLLSILIISLNTPVAQAALDIDGIYVDWPFYYMLDTSTLMFAWPPVSGLWVFYC